MKTLVTFLIVAVVAAAGGWWFGSSHHHLRSAPSTAGEKQVLYYQSTMHPWVKSDKPGKCTVCGMELVPVYAGGELRTPGSATDIVMLPEGSANTSNVKTVAVKWQTLTRTLHVAGTIDDDESRHRILSAYSAGRIEKLFVNFEGGDVEKGQPLALFYSKELLNAANEYKLTAKQNNSSLLENIESRLLQFGLVREQIRKIPQRAEGDLFFEILAPVTGTVVKRHVYEGQYVNEGEKLFELADFSTMWFQFIAYEQDLPYLREGLPVSISTPSLPGKTLDSVVKFINPNLDSLTRSARVRVEVPNPTSELGLHRKHEVLHKLYATATVQLDAPEVLAVPRNAVLWSGRNPRVYIEQDTGIYQQRRVILGRSGDEIWEVLEGVKDGERVVASGNMLIDGQAQLNNLAAPETEAPPSSDLAMEMSPTEHETLENYLVAMAALTETLANDDLAAFNNALAQLPTAPPPLQKTVPPPANDLASARRSFLPLSEAIADYALKVRGHFPKLTVFRCPMSDQAGKDIPKNAKWIQLSAELRNPFMGREMLHCGTEVR